MGQEITRRQQLIRRAISILLPALFVVFGVLVLSDSVMPTVRRFSYSSWYRHVLLLLGVWAVVKLLRGPRWKSERVQHAGGLRAVLASARKATGLTFYRWAGFIVLSLAAFMPIFRCFFSIPYLFCHVCPQKCIFGIVRPYLVPSALLVNLRNRQFCYGTCPIGTLHDCQPCLRKRWRVPNWCALAVGLLALAFVAVGYFKVTELDPDSSWFFDYFIGSYSSTSLVIAFAAVSLFLGVVIWRPFCSFLCPIGNTSEWISKTTRVIKGRWERV